MKISVNSFDIILLIVFAYFTVAINPWFSLVVILVTMGWFINPRWSRESGWRFKHD